MQNLIKQNPTHASRLPSVLQSAFAKLLGGASPFQEDTPQQAQSLTYGSVFTGVGGLDIGFDNAGMTCRWMIEVDKNCQKLLQAWRPGLPVYSDVNDVVGTLLERVNVLIGGFPCVDLSGCSYSSKLGFTGEKSGLIYQFARLVFEVRPEVFVLENVTALASAKNLAILRSMWQFEGYTLTNVTLSASDHGSFTRRNRAIVVGYWTGHACTEAPLDLAGTIARPCPVSETAGRRDTLPMCLPWKGGVSLERLGSCLLEDPRSPSSLAARSLRTILQDDATEKYRIPATAMDRLFGAEGSKVYSRCACPGMAGFRWTEEDHAQLRSMVRKLTPTEQERAMSLPTNHTDGFNFSDSIRYLMTGNAVPTLMATAVGDWITDNWPALTENGSPTPGRK